MAYVFIIVYRRTIKLELKNIVVMIRYVYAVKHILAIKINLLVMTTNIQEYTILNDSLAE